MFLPISRAYEKTFSAILSRSSISSSQSVVLGPTGSPNPFRKSLRSLLFPLNVCVRPDLCCIYIIQNNTQNRLNGEADMRIQVSPMKLDIKGSCKTAKQCHSSPPFFFFLESVIFFIKNVIFVDMQ